MTTALQRKVAAAADAQDLSATQKAAMVKAVSDTGDNTAVTAVQTAAKQLGNDSTVSGPKPAPSVTCKVA